VFHYQKKTRPAVSSCTGKFCGCTNGNSNVKECTGGALARWRPTNQFTTFYFYFLLFIIFINDICACIHFSSFLLYAHDLKFYRTVSNVNDSILLQSDLDSIGSWCSKNSLPLNLNKCHIVRYAKRSVTIPSTYHINNHPLSVLNEIIDLGVLFDDKFLFNELLNFILPLLRALRLFNSLPSSIRFSWGANKYMPRQTLREYF